MGKKMEFWMSLGNLSGLHPDSALYDKSLTTKLEALLEHQFVGVSGVTSEMEVELFNSFGLKYGITVPFPSRIDGEKAVKEALEKSPESLTIHLGDGTNSTEELDDWLEWLLPKSNDIPMYLEIHRSTATQDIYRTISLAKLYPEIRFVADFSHWYTGLLLGQNFEKKVSFMDPVFERCDVIHGRVANDGCIQPPLNDVRINAFYHFKTLWKSVLDKSSSETNIPFVIELLGHELGYDPGVRQASGIMVDSTDRWKDALKLKDMVTEWFNEN